MLYIKELCSLIRTINEDINHSLFLHEKDAMFFFFFLLKIWCESFNLRPMRPYDTFLIQHKINNLILQRSLDVGCFDSCYISISWVNEGPFDAATYVGYIVWEMVTKLPINSLFIWKLSTDMILWCAKKYFMSPKQCFFRNKEQKNRRRTNDRKTLKV